jgi:hypothetical protein
MTLLKNIFTRIREEEEEEEEEEKRKRENNETKWTVENVINRPLHTARFRFFSILMAGA